MAPTWAPTWRILPILLLPGLAGCVAGEAVVGVEAASVAVFGRDVIDIGVSAISGRDCSVVRLDRKQPYCAAREELPPPPPFCSRTLANVQCWADPEHFPSQPRQIADTPGLTVEQTEQVKARWPKSLNLFE